MWFFFVLNVALPNLNPFLNTEFGKINQSIIKIYGFHLTQENLFWKKKREVAKGKKCDNRVPMNDSKFGEKYSLLHLPSLQKLL